MLSMSLWGRLSSGRSSSWVTWEGVWWRQIRVGILILTPLSPQVPLSFVVSLCLLPHPPSFLELLALLCNQGD